jgi:AsnC-type helix-turn-helix domain
VDELDHKIITKLRHNSRQSVSDLAVELGLSRATVRARIERLEKAGTILGYTVVLKSDAIELPVRGIMMVEIEGHETEKVVGARYPVILRFPPSTPPTADGTWLSNWAPIRWRTSMLCCGVFDSRAASSTARRICCWQRHALPKQGCEKAGERCLSTRCLGLQFIPRPSCASARATRDAYGIRRPS